MTDFTSTAPAAIQSPAPAVWQTIRRTWKPIAALLARRAAARALHGLDDYMLKDMGLNRGNIEGALREAARRPLRRNP